jgi:site-specific DNA recombinase
MQRAALYLRSSKDRSDISLAAQRHELEKIATSRSLQIVRSFEDAVESGATENRPGFIELVRAIKDASRGWEFLLVYDTSRIARRRYIAQAIKHEARKRGVQILYAKLPADLDPVAELVLESVFEAMDEAHSLMSREKGLAGMAENVRQGWRAGGRAPLGYRLSEHATGAVREGRPVTKSKLVADIDAVAVRSFLKARAAGVPRVRALEQAKLEKSDTTMIGVEWNALTYAGHTVWNRHAADGTGHKRRDRSQWQITRDTHEALITDGEAEAILAQLQTSEIGAAISRAKASSSGALLTGLLVTSSGQMWVAHGKKYRLRSRGGKRGRVVLADQVDEAVIEQIRTDVGSDLFLRKLLDAGKRHRHVNDPTVAIAARIKKLEREKARAAELALTEDPTPFLQIVSDRKRQVDALRHELTAIQAGATLTEHVANYTPEKLRQLIAERAPARLITTLVERIVLEPDLSCRLQYKAISGRAGWRSMASPGRFEDWPPELTVTVPLRLVTGRAASATR